MGEALAFLLVCSAIDPAAQEEPASICTCKPREVGAPGSRVDWDGYRKGIRWRSSVEEAMRIAFANVLHGRMHAGAKRSTEAAESYRKVHEIAGGNGMRDYGAIVHSYLARQRLVDVNRFGTRFLATLTDIPKCQIRKKD